MTDGGEPQITVTFTAFAPPGAEPFVNAPDELTEVGWWTLSDLEADVRCPSWLPPLIRRACARLVKSPEPVEGHSARSTSSAHIADLIENAEADGLGEILQLVDQFGCQAAGHVSDHIAQLAPSREHLALDVHVGVRQQSVNRGKHAGHVLMNMQHTAPPGRLGVCAAPGEG